MATKTKTKNLEKFQEYIGKDGIKTFQYRYRIDGKQKTKSFKALNNTKAAETNALKAAEKFAKNLEAQKILGLAMSEEDILFKDYASQFMNIHLGKRKTTTKKSYEYLLNIINKDIGHLKLKNITANKLDELFIKYRDKYALNTQKGLFKIIKLIFLSARKKKVIKENPVLNIDFVFTEEDTVEKTVKVLDIDLINQIINYLGEWKLKYKHFVQVAINTGMRRGEVLALKWENVNLVNNFILVKENYNKFNEITTVKNGKERIIPINKSLRKSLLEIKKYQSELKQIFGNNYNENDLVVCHEDGGYIGHGALDVAFEKISKEFRHVTSHMLRHTFATMMRGAEIKDIQMMTGHSKVETLVNIYQHHDMFQDETLKSLDDKFKIIN